MTLLAFLAGLALGRLLWGPKPKRPTPSKRTDAADWLRNNGAPSQVRVDDPRHDALRRLEDYRPTALENARRYTRGEATW